MSEKRGLRRAAIWLCAYQGMTREEAAAALGWPRSRVNYYLKGVSRQAVPSAHPGGWRNPNANRDEAGRFR